MIRDEGCGEGCMDIWNGGRAWGGGGGGGGRLQCKMI